MAKKMKRVLVYMMAAVMAASFMTVQVAASDASDAADDPLVSWSAGLKRMTAVSLVARRIIPPPTMTGIMSFSNSRRAPLSGSIMKMWIWTAC